MSITLRLILALSLLMAVFWTATAFLTRNVFVDEIDEIVTENMATSAQHLMPLVLKVLKSKTESGETGAETAVQELPEFGNEAGQLAVTSGGYLAFEVRNGLGQVVLRSGDVADFGLPQAPKPGYVHWRDVLAFTLVDPSSGFALTVLEPSVHRSDAINEATKALAWPLLYLVPLLALAILILSRFSLAPVKGLSIEIAERGGGNLEPLAAVGQPSELRPIVSAVDRLMERLRVAMDAERVFAANAAHEMRTPLAGALAQAQRLKAEVGAAAGAARVVEIEATLKRLADFSEKLLQLSRAEAGLGQRGERQNMTPVIDAVLREFRNRSSEPSLIAFDNPLGQDLMVAMDADAFAICLRNLLENALLHGARDQPVRLVIGQDWTVRVINEAPVVAPDQLARLKERHVRGATRATGSGLGLAIVDRIMRQSEGKLELLSPATRQDTGFEAVLVLP